MKHRILFLGKTGAGYLEKGIEEYLKRLRHYTNCHVQILKTRRKSSGDQPLAEAKTLLDALGKGGLTVALDSRGKQLTSEELADCIARWEMAGTKEITYLIGGPEGFHETVIERADMLLSFSRMTFTHDMIRLLLLEQLYRAYTILAGEKYHK